MLDAIGSYIYSILIFLECNPVASYSAPSILLEYSDQLDADLYSDTRESGTKMERNL
jgi:hypothetical protein